MRYVVERWIIVAAIGLISWLPGPVIADPIVQQKVQYYLIRPDTVESIKVELKNKSPIQRNSQVFHGRTTWQVIPMFKWKSFAGKCGIVGLHVELQTEYLMPALNDTVSNPEVKRVFDVYYAGLLKHEQGHHALGLAAAEAIERFLKTYRPVESCHQLETDVTREIQSLIQHFEMKNDEYDKQTGYGRSQGAVIQ